MHYGLGENGELFIVREAQPRPQCFPLRKREETKHGKSTGNEVSGGIPVATRPVASLSGNKV